MCNDVVTTEEIGRFSRWLYATADLLKEESKANKHIAADARACRHVAGLLTRFLIQQKITEKLQNN